MSEQCPDILRCDPQDLRQAMSIHTRKITDACRDKDCVEDLRFYPTATAQRVLSTAQGLRVGSAELIYTFVAGFVSGLLALGLTRLGLGHQADKIMIGDIMLLIPGLLLVNAIKEMFNRDIVTGLYRLIEAVLVALAIAGGYALAFLVMGGAAA